MSWKPINWIADYQDASRFKTYPRPLTDFRFAGLSDDENTGFKVWLGMIGEDEISIAADQELEIHFVKAFQEQRGSHVFTPARLAMLVDFENMNALVSKKFSALNGGFEWWQMVQYVPTQSELIALVSPVTLKPEKDKSISLVEKLQPKNKKQTTKRSVCDARNLDLFEETA